MEVGGIVRRLGPDDRSNKTPIALGVAVIPPYAPAKSSSAIPTYPRRLKTITDIMVFNAFSAALVGLTALSVAGLVNAHPQQFFQQQTGQAQTQPQQIQNQPQQPQYEPISEVCLGCICESISSCNRNLTCEGDVCGMFRITWAYWADSGKPVLQGDNPSDGLAYARCANDPSCARQSAVNYLTRFAQDCNRDGIINCLDYASIHKLGGYGCSAPLDWEYKNKYDACQKAVNELSGSPSPALDQPIDLRFGPKE